MAGAGQGETGDLGIEDVSSCLRSESGTKSLTPVRRDLYQAMVRLIARYDKECEKALSDDPLSIISEGVRLRRNKAASESRRIAEIRMGKICSIAIRNSMGAKVPVESLPQEEKEFYDGVYAAVMGIWNVMDRKKKVTIPDIAPESEPPSRPPEPAVEEPAPEPPKAEPQAKSQDEVPLSDMPFIDDGPETEEPDFDEPFDQPATLPPEEEPEAAEAPADPFADGSMSVIRITGQVPPFAGPERDYVLRKGDVVKMPTPMADILVNGSLAVRIRF